MKNSFEGMEKCQWFTLQKIHGDILMPRVNTWLSGGGELGTRELTHAFLSNIGILG